MTRYGLRDTSRGREFRGFFDAGGAPQVDRCYVTTRGQRVRQWLGNPGAGLFAWGPGCVTSFGSMRLARALVLAVAGKKVADTAALAFRMKVVDELPREWRLTEADIRRAVREKE